AHGFGGRASEHPLRRLIEKNDAVIFIHRDNGVHCSRHDGRQPLLAFAQRLLDPYQVLNVRERACPTHDPALGIAARLRAVEEPAVASVRGSIAALALEGHTRSHGGAPLRQCVLGLVWMIGPDKPPPGSLLRRHTGVGEPLVTGKSVIPVLIAFVGGTRNRRDHCAETQLACAQRLLNLLALMNIDARADIAEKVAAGRGAGDAMIQYPAILAIIAPQTVLHLEWFARVE